MNNKEYGVKLNVDISDLTKKLDRAKELAEQAKQNIEVPLNNVKVAKAQFRYDEQAKKVEDISQEISKQEKLAEGLSNAWYGYVEEIKGTEAQLEAVNKELATMKQYHEDISNILKQYGMSMQELTVFDTNMRAREDALGLEKIEHRLNKILPDKENKAWEEFELAKQKIAELTNELEKQNRILEIYGLEVEEAKGNIKGMGDEVEETEGKTNNLGTSFANLSKNITKSIDKGVRNIKRFALSLFGVQSAYSIVSKAVRSYMSYDTEANARIQANWIALGAMIAPIVEKIVGWIQKLVAYINVFYKALTGRSFIQMALDKVKDKANKAGKAVGELNKQLASFDEITNLSFDQGSGASDFGIADALEELNNVELDKEWVDRIEYIAGWLNKYIIEPVSKFFENIEKSDVFKFINELFKILISGKIVEVIDTILTFLGNKLSATGLAGVFVIVKGIFDVIEGAIKFYKDRDNREAFGELIRGIGEIILGVGLLTGNPILDVVGALILLSGLLTEFWDNIEKWYNEWSQNINPDIKRTLDAIVDWVEEDIEYCMRIWDSMFTFLDDLFHGRWNKLWGDFLNIAGGYIDLLIMRITDTINILGSLFGFDFKGFLEGKINKSKGGGFGRGFAKGNVAYGPTVAEFGEYAGARSNPEITAPQNIMKQTMIEALQEALPQGGSRGGDTVLYVNGKELARATYGDFQSEGNRLGSSNVVIRRV